MTRELLALIPARGGSKGLPRKNVLPLGGKPLIAHTIETALATSLVTRTIVSTDDAEIAEVARAYGAEVPFTRPTELAQDESTDLDVFRHALQWLAREEGYAPELVAHLRPTNPFRVPGDVDAALGEMLEHPEADALRSVSWPAQTPYKMWRESGGYLLPLLEMEGVAEPYSMPRQALPEVWWQNGYVDVVRPRTVLELGSMAGRRALPFVVEDPGVEIDYADVLQKAEELLQRRMEGRDDRAHGTRHPA
jgi:CMP-N,N'-diacetyllegionaminic acid synthase